MNTSLFIIAVITMCMSGIGEAGRLRREADVAARRVSETPGFQARPRLLEKTKFVLSYYGTFATCQKCCWHQIPVCVQFVSCSIPDTFINIMWLLFVVRSPREYTPENLELQITLFDSREYVVPVFTMVVKRTVKPPSCLAMCSRWSCQVPDGPSILMGTLWQQPAERLPCPAAVSRNPTPNLDKKCLVL